MLGVIWPGWDVEGGVIAFSVGGHCFYGTFHGERLAGQRNWQGRRSAKEQGDRIGMLLDLDQGSMTVFKNDQTLGVMLAEGLSGLLCCAATLGSAATVHLYYLRSYNIHTLLHHATPQASSSSLLAGPFCVPFFNKRSASLRSVHRHEQPAERLKHPSFVV